MNFNNYYINLDPIKKEIKFITHYMKKHLNEDEYIKFYIKPICFNKPEYIKLIWHYGDVVYVDEQNPFDDILLSESYSLEGFLTNKTTHAINLSKNKYIIINQIKKLKK